MGQVILPLSKLSEELIKMYIENGFFMTTSLETVTKMAITKTVMSMIQFL